MHVTFRRGTLPGRTRPTSGTTVPGFVGLLLLQLAVSACSESGQPVVFGLAGPMQEGYGASTRMGAELAQKEINAAGGISGRPVKLRIQDDEASPERAIVVAEELFEDPAVLAVAGHVNSGAMTAAAPVYDRGLPALATSATSPAIARLGPWIFRVASSDSANAVALAQLARSMSEGKTAILYENDDYGRGLSESFRSALVAAGGEILEADPYLLTTQDFTPYLERLRRKGADLIFVAGLEEGASRIITQARDLGLNAHFLGGDGLEGLMAMGQMYEGTLVGLMFHQDASPASSGFTERFRAAYGREPDSFAALGYDAVQLLARAAAEGGASRSAIRAYLEGVGRPGGTQPFEGASGTIRFDERGDPAEKAFAVGVIRNGRIELEDGGR